MHANKIYLVLNLCIELSSYSVFMVLPYRWSKITSCCVTPTSYPYHRLHHRRPLGLPAWENNLHNGWHHCTAVSCVWLFCHSRRSCFSLQTLSVIEATVKIKSINKSPEKWQLLADMIKYVGCKYFWLKFLREGLLVFFNTKEDLSRLTANDVIVDLSNNVFIIVVPQKII